MTYVCCVCYVINTSSPSLSSHPLNAFFNTIPSTPFHQPIHQRTLSYAIRNADRVASKVEVRKKRTDFLKAARLNFKEHNTKQTTGAAKGMFSNAIAFAREQKVRSLCDILLSHNPLFVIPTPLTPFSPTFLSHTSLPPSYFPPLSIGKTSPRRSQPQPLNPSHHNGLQPLDKTSETSVLCHPQTKR